MKFVTFNSTDGPCFGVTIAGDRILDLHQASGKASGSFVDLVSLIEAGAAGLNGVRALVAKAEAGELKTATVKLVDAELLAPIPRPRKNVFCVGRNYVEHVKEGYRASGADIKLPEFPQFFTKPPTAVIGPNAPILLHAGITEKLDYEVELAVIIGRSGRGITEAQAYDHIFGFTILNDVTARDLQRRHDQWFKGKALDNSAPMGPWVVHRDDIADPQKLDIALRVNGEIRQNSNTAHMIFPIRRIISDLSQGLTLEAGDIIATGTPSGVGYAMDPPQALKAGDVVTCEIEGIGKLENRVT